MVAVINIVSLILDNFVKNRRERKGGLQRKRKSNTVRPIIPIFFDAFAASFPVFFDAISACFTSRTYFISLILRLIFLSNGEQVLLLHSPYSSRVAKCLLHFFKSHSLPLPRSI